jgi:hypothetical protein
MVPHRELPLTVMALFQICADDCHQLFLHHPPDLLWRWRSSLHDLRSADLGSVKLSPLPHMRLLNCQHYSNFRAHAVLPPYLITATKGNPYTSSEIAGPILATETTKGRKGRY